MILRSEKAGRSHFLDSIFFFLEKIGKAIVLERRALAEMENYNLCLLSLGKRKLLQV